MRRSLELISPRLLEGEDGDMSESLQPITFCETSVPDFYYNVVWKLEWQFHLNIAYWMWGRWTPRRMMLQPLQPCCSCRLRLFTGPILKPLVSKIVSIFDLNITTFLCGKKKKTRASVNQFEAHEPPLYPHLIETTASCDLEMKPERLASQSESRSFSKQTECYGYFNWTLASVFFCVLPLALPLVTRWAAAAGTALIASGELSAGRCCWSIPLHLRSISSSSRISRWSQRTLLRNLPSGLFVWIRGNPFTLFHCNV